MKSMKYLLPAIIVRSSPLVLSHNRVRLHPTMQTHFASSTSGSMRNANTIRCPALQSAL
ncbi:MAG TPA: hypothetical protein VK508_18645 [Cyclobacteriaceae bacterium]|nr:hypothetical protein [Cyclobacteriaceae bacterium]